MREIITLQCGECKNRNYRTTKDKRNQDRLEPIVRP
jgi:ribosomal protein L33